MKQFRKNLVCFLEKITLPIDYKGNKDTKSQ
jgi:hypothetical protein